MAMVFSGLSRWSFASVAFGPVAVHHSRACSRGSYSDHVGWEAETERAGLPVI